VYHLLSLLESDAAGVVAAHATAEQLAELGALHAELEDAAKPGTANADAFFAVNERFHMRLLEIANNRWRDQMVADLRKVMKLYRQNSLQKSGRVAQSLAEHRVIMDALVARDACASAVAMRSHLASGLNAAM